MMVGRWEGEKETRKNKDIEGCQKEWNMEYVGRGTQGKGDIPHNPWRFLTMQQNPAKHNLLEAAREEGRNEGWRQEAD